MNKVIEISIYFILLIILLIIPIIIIMIYRKIYRKHILQKLSKSIIVLQEGVTYNKRFYNHFEVEIVITVNELIVYNPPSELVRINKYNDIKCFDYIFIVGLKIFHNNDVIIIYSHENKELKDFIKKRLVCSIL